MEIRPAAASDFVCLNAYDKHIAGPELERAIQLGRVYIIEEHGTLAGWLRYNLFWDNTPFLNMLYILDGSRGRGLGTQLLAYWERRMWESGYGTVMTSTASDETAQHFYNKLGYSTIGGFLLGQEPFELILSKRLLTAPGTLDAAESPS